MKKLLIATLAVFFFIGVVQADDAPIEPEVIAEAIEEVVEEPTAEPTEEAIEEVMIEEVVEELAVEEVVIEEVIEEVVEEKPCEWQDLYKDCFNDTGNEFISCSISYTAKTSGASLVVIKDTKCSYNCLPGSYIKSEVVATYTSSTEFYGD